MISSEPLEIIGPSGRRFFAEENLLIRHSPILHAEIDAVRLEVGPRVVKIQDFDDDIDDDTVVRFLDWASRGNYLVSVSQSRDSMTLMSREVRPTAPNFQQAHQTSSGQQIGKQTLTTKNQGDPRSDMIENGKDQGAYDGFVLGQPYSLKQFTLQNHLADEDGTDLLVQARLYVFSVRYACDSLRRLCLNRIEETLARSESYSVGVCGVVDLARYTFTHTPDYENRSDDLRDLVIKFIVSHYREFFVNSAFLELIAEQNGLTRQLSDSLRRFCE